MTQTLVHRISCGKEQMVTCDTNTDLVHLAFRSDAQVAGLGFAIQFRIICEYSCT